MNKIHHIGIPIYRECLRVFFGSLESCVEALKAEGVPEITCQMWTANADTFIGSCSMLSHDFFLFWMPDKPQSIDDFSTIVHELEHAVFYILKKKGITHSEDSDEAYAYLLGWLYSEIMVILNNLEG